MLQSLAGMGRETHESIILKEPLLRIHVLSYSGGQVSCLQLAVLFPGSVWGMSIGCSPGRAWMTRALPSSPHCLQVAHLLLTGLLIALFPLLGQKCHHCNPAGGRLRANHSRQGCLVAPQTPQEDKHLGPAACVRF